MRFVVVPPGRSALATPNTATLVTDNWNDWFEFSTLYGLKIRDRAGALHDIGGVKIGQFGMTESRPDLPTEFTGGLEDKFFSLGQDDSYYEALNALGPDVCERVLTSLRDTAYDLDLFERAQTEKVMRSSLLRSVSPRTVRRRFHPLVHGNAELTPFHFSFTAPPPPPIAGIPVAPLRLTFDVEPESFPPTNVHVLIGRNGVGKTRLLGNLTGALLAPTPDEAAALGTFETTDDEEPGSAFANLVSVTFSAFDPFMPHDDSVTQRAGLRYAYVGLRRLLVEDSAEARPRDESAGDRRDQRPTPATYEAELAKWFGYSVRACRLLGKVRRWRTALDTLESDPLFREAEVSQLGEIEDMENLQEQAQRLFRRFSSGHKIVLLTITRLVELVDERTLVLLDEPEAHLHPPLLAAFVRALSHLLIQRNGVAVVATHSPVILQEVPRTCVWVLRRSGAVSQAERPEVETFGENVGVLTREVFGLEVTESGFHRLIRDAVASGLDFDGVTRRFGHQLGAEALALARALVLTRNSSQDDPAAADA